MRVANANANAGGSARTAVIVRVASTDDIGTVAATANASGASVGYVYDQAFPGFSAVLPAQAAAALAHNPHVVSVEPDMIVTADTTEAPTPSWGLDRVDQHPLALDNSYSYSNTGVGVTAYIVDTGIRASHQEFVGRVGQGFTAINDGQGTNDCNGHGTHVSGTVGGTEYGIAKGVTIVPVRVLNCQGSGSTSGVIAGINYAISAHTSGPAVLNMSLGGGASAALDDAVASATADGITVVVAAGNSNTDACTQSPAEAPTALTVGATTSTDARASLLELRPLPGPLRPGRRHHVCVELLGLGVEHDLRNVDGLAARRRRGGPLPPGESHCDSCCGGRGADPVGDPGRGGQPWRALAEPAGVG